MSLTSAFDALWQSNVDLHDRFGVRRTIPKAVRLVSEEYREVVDEANAPDVNTQALAHEMADLLMTLFGLAIAAGLTRDDIESAFGIVIDKNNAKIPGVTHALNPHTGKITRLVVKSEPEPSPIESFKQGWKEAMAGDVHPIETLWDELEIDEP